MAMIKTGDAQKIDGIFVDDKQLVCDKCGRPINTIKMDADTNIPTCMCEETDDE